MGVGLGTPSGHLAPPRCSPRPEKLSRQLWDPIPSSEDAARRQPQLLERHELGAHLARRPQAAGALRPAQKPARKALRSMSRHRSNSVGNRIGIDDDEPWHEGLRLGDGHADHHAKRLGIGIEGSDGSATAGAPDQDERPLRRRRCGARLPSEAVCRPPWKEERYDPWRRRPPLQSLHFRRPGIGSARPTNGRGRDRVPARPQTAVPTPASG